MIASTNTSSNWRRRERERERERSAISQKTQLGSVFLCWRLSVDSFHCHPEILAPMLSALFINQKKKYFELTTIPAATDVVLIPLFSSITDLNPTHVHVSRQTCTKTACVCALNHILNKRYQDSQLSSSSSSPRCAASPLRPFWNNLWRRAVNTTDAQLRGRSILRPKEDLWTLLPCLFLDRTAERHYNNCGAPRLSYAVSKTKTTVLHCLSY